MDTRQPYDRQRQQYAALHDEQTHVAAQGSAVTSHQVPLPGWLPWNNVWKENLFKQRDVYLLKSQISMQVIHTVQTSPKTDC